MDPEEMKQNNQEGAVRWLVEIAK